MKGNNNTRGKFRKKGTDKRDTRKDNRIPERDEKRNDPATWNKGNLATDAGRLQFIFPMGMDNNLDSPSHAGHITLNGLAASKSRFPGIMRMLFAPTFGKSDSVDDPVNVATEKWFSKVRQNQAAGAQYDPADLMMFWLKLDTNYMWHAELTRLYGVMMNYTFSQYNYYMPRTVVNALGFDYDDILQHLDELRFHINYIGQRINTWKAPRTIEFFARHVMLASNIFWDSNTVKSQMYVYVPGVYGKFIDETEGPGYIQSVFRPNYKMTYSDILAHTATLFESLTITQSAGYMNGDTIRTFGEEGCFSTAYIPDTFVYNPVYSEEVLGQIMNNTIFHNVGYIDGKFLYQDSNTRMLNSGLRIKVIVPAYDSKRIMRSFKDNPDPIEVMINSRGMVTGSIDPNSAGQIGTTGWYQYDFIPTSLGTEIIFDGEIFVIDPDSTNGYQSQYVNTYGAYISALPAGDRANGDKALSWSTFFSGCPLLFRSTRKTEYDAEKHLYNWELNSIGNIDSYSIVTDSQVDMLHTAALMSVFSIPD